MLSAGTQISHTLSSLICFFSSSPKSKSSGAPSSCVSCYSPSSRSMSSGAPSSPACRSTSSGTPSMPAYRSTSSGTPSCQHVQERKARCLQPLSAAARSRGANVVLSMLDVASRTWRQRTWESNLADGADCGVSSASLGSASSRQQTSTPICYSDPAVAANQRRSRWSQERGLEDGGSHGA